MKLTTGLKRLLRLADILDVADAQHRAKKEPTYDQSTFKKSCGTPACALGHWAAHNPRRWKFDTTGHPYLRTTEPLYGISFEDASQEFGIDHHAINELFEYNGCGRAKTGKQAAKFIRKFVKARQQVAA